MSLTAPFISVSVHSVEFLQINFPGGNLVVESDCHSHKLLNCVYRTGLSTKIVTTTNFSYYFVNHHSFKSEFCSVHAQNDKLRDSLPYLNLVVTSERRVLGLCKSFIRVAMSRNCDIYTCSHRLLDPFIISLKYQFQFSSALITQTDEPQLQLSLSLHSTNPPVIKLKSPLQTRPCKRQAIFA